MKIQGIDGLENEQLKYELAQGAKFVMYEYCISILVMTFKRRSDIFFIRPQESRLGKGMTYTLLSLVAGWWGIPWGPIYTCTSVFNNLSGGVDVTPEVAKLLGVEV